MAVYTNKDIIYAAGIIDGEGCIDIAYNNPQMSRPYGQYYVRVTLHNTSLELLEWFKLRWKWSLRKLKFVEINHKQLYDWKLCAGRVMRFLKEIHPYLIVKKEEATIALLFNISKKVGRKGLSQEELITRKHLKQQLHESKSYGRRIA